MDSYGIILYNCQEETLHKLKMNSLFDIVKISKTFVLACKELQTFIDIYFPGMKFQVAIVKYRFDNFYRVQKLNLDYTGFFYIDSRSFDNLQKYKKVNFTFNDLLKGVTDYLTESVTYQEEYFEYSQTLTDETIDFILQHLGKASVNTSNKVLKFYPFTGYTDVSNKLKLKKLSTSPVDMEFVSL